MRLIIFQCSQTSPLFKFFKIEVVENLMSSFHSVVMLSNTAVSQLVLLDHTQAVVIMVCPIN